MIMGREMMRTKEELRNAADQIYEDLCMLEYEEAVLILADLWFRFQAEYTKNYLDTFKEEFGSE